MKSFSHRLGPRAIGLILILVLSAISLCSALGQAPPSSKRPPFRVGYFADPSNGSDIAPLRPTIASWTGTIAPLNSPVATTAFEPDAQRLSDAVSLAACDLYGLYGYQLLGLEDPSLLRPAIATEGGRGVTSTFLLIRRKGERNHSINSLRGEEILVDTRGFGRLPLIWLDTQIATAVSPDNVENFATVRAVHSPARALLPVYFGRVAACVITRSAFIEANKLNPELFTRLEVSSKSKPLLVSILAFHRDFPLAAAKKITLTALQESNSKQSQRVFELIARNGIGPYDESSIEPLRELYNQHQAIFGAAASGDPPSLSSTTDRDANSR